MSKIPISEPVSWRPDTPLPPPTSTTSVEGKLTLMAKSIGIADADPLVWVLIATVLVSAFVSVMASFLFMSRLDGLRWVGWTGTEVAMNGKNRHVMLPLYMTPQDVRALQEEK